MIKTIKKVTMIIIMTVCNNDIDSDTDNIDHCSIVDNRLRQHPGTVVKIYKHWCRIKNSKV
ncbi:MAG: hypothetical protein ACLUTF_05080 [Anaerostipes hadrus]